MPIFLYWCLPLVLLFCCSVFMGFSKGVIVMTFLLSYCGFIVAFVRSVIIAKETPINKKRYNNDKS